MSQNDSSGNGRLLVRKAPISFSGRKSESHLPQSRSDRIFARLDQLSTDFERVANRAPARLQVYSHVNDLSRNLRIGYPGIPSGEVVRILGPNFPIFYEIRSLSERAGIIVLEILEARQCQEKFKAYKNSFFDSSIRLEKPLEFWLNLLIRSPGTQGCCWSMDAKGKTSGVAFYDSVPGEEQIGADPYVRIPSYPQVCLAAVAWLKNEVLKAAGHEGENQPHSRCRLEYSIIRCHQLDMARISGQSTGLVASIGSLRPKRRA